MWELLIHVNYKAIERFGFYYCSRDRLVDEQPISIGYFDMAYGFQAPRPLEADFRLAPCGRL